uniref:Uncharacterized protein n=1 Tax=Mycena chlorophos TaxID=658473 RepID=A0ABQ0LX38_MYCCL|nr:predicted protein [Mycena chlorophos]
MPRRQTMMPRAFSELSDPDLPVRGDGWGFVVTVNAARLIFGLRCTSYDTDRSVFHRSRCRSHKDRLTFYTSDLLRKRCRRISRIYLPRRYPSIRVGALFTSTRYSRRRFLVTCDEQPSAGAFPAARGYFSLNFDLPSRPFYHSTIALSTLLSYPPTGLFLARPVYLLSFPWVLGSRFSYDSDTIPRKQQVQIIEDYEEITVREQIQSNTIKYQDLHDKQNKCQ